MALRRRPKGVVLLLILSLLVLIALLGMTFLIGATRYRHGAESFSQRDLRGDDPAKVLDMAVFQLLREPANPYSSLWGHSLLLDLYGRDATGGTIDVARVASTSTGNIAMGEIIQLDVTFDTANFGDPSSRNDHYAGCVITLIEDPLNPPSPRIAPQSSRVVRYIASTGAGVPAKLYVEQFETDWTTLNPVLNGSPKVGFLINGKPFNGQGVGYDVSAGGTWNVSTALSPHYAAYLAASINWSPPVGEPDESYDALDHQNMFLAKNPPGGNEIVGSFHRPELIKYVQSNLSAWDSSDPNYRSFRRRFIFRPMPWDHPNFTGSNANFAPATINGYVAWTPGADGQPGRSGVDDDGDGSTDNNNVDTDGDGTFDYSTELGAPGSDDVLANDAALVQRLIDAGAIVNRNTRYDVDNDGDGFNDSFWLDLQLPVKTAANGRLYKPLVAFLVCDMDGRLNVNAHGNLAQTQDGFHTGEMAPAPTRPFAGHNGALTRIEQHDTDGDGNADWPAHGQGYGPAEISFRHLLTGTRSNVTLYQNVLLSRYSADSAPGSSAQDFLTFLKAVGRPEVFASATSTTYGSWDNPSAFFLPPDIHGRGTVALNNAGQPIWRYAGRSGNFSKAGGGNINDASGTALVFSETENHPYEFNPVRPDGNDAPFTPAELERVLRWRDGDAGVLANRLFNFMNSGSTSIAELSKLITTRSAYIPAPPTVPLGADTTASPELFDILYPSAGGTLDGNVAQIGLRTTPPLRPASIIDLMAAKMVQAYATQSPPVILQKANPAHLQAVQDELDRLLAFEFRRGQKMDPNRLWGNGEDNAGHPEFPYVVDEQWHNHLAMPPTTHWESDTDSIWSGSGAAGSANFANDDPAWGTRTAYHPRGREMYARHLFCLMMLMADLDYVPTAVTKGQPQPGFMEPYFDASITTDVQRRELTIRRIAQWAVNAVDFRDADAIMTPFEYDVNPWNGWEVDGDIATDESGSNPNSERRVVWGCESPALVITETLAFHDRRVKDTKLESASDDDQTPAGDPETRAGMPTPDHTLDQYRVPQGSLFVELYCPRRNFYSNGAEGDFSAVPRELYDVISGDVRLDLGRLAPPVSSGGLRYPVWRLAISEPHRPGGPNIGPLELTGTRNMRDNVAFQPYSSAQPDEMYVVEPTPSNAIPRLPIERIVWFAQQDPSSFSTFEQNRVYYNRYGAEEVSAGEYLVVGPRAVTHIGSQDTGKDINANEIELPSTQQFALASTSGGAQASFSYAGDNAYPNATQIKLPVKTIIAGANPPTNWNLNPHAETCDLWAGGAGGMSAPVIPGVGLSVTEPLRHQYYDEPSEFLDNGAATANYPLRDAFRDVVGGIGNLPDIPFDTDSDHSGYLPIRDDSLAETRTYSNYKTAFLQRLANPLLPWHPQRNPYITVDWHPIDVTVFNGEDRERSGGSSWDPDDPNRNTSTDRNPNDPPFESREREGQRVDNVNYGLWRPQSSNAQQAETTPRSGDFFRLNARHSLGYLNRKLDGNDQDLDVVTSGPTHATAIGDPQLPFPWLTWNDRPYVSHLELMMVPASSPNRLLFEFQHRHPADSNGDPYEPYNMTTPPANAGSPPYSSYRSSYGHLLNFFNTTRKSQIGTSTQGANFYRLLDFVEVPSRFAGAEKWYNPAQIRSAASTAVDVERFRPPFNSLSRFSDPGRVNVNTIWDWRVWAGVSDGFPLMANQTSWTSIHNTLQSGAGSNAPTPYPNPLRAAGAAQLAPTIPGGNDVLLQDGVEATLLRSANPSATPRQPLLDNPNFAHLGSSPAAAHNLAVHPRPNAYFRYQGLQRLGNLVSSQSNVYAVWLTVGYFEVEKSRAGQRPEHPDGFLLGAELGWDTGEIVRHRAFYMIDRSIPVAFPGTKNNTPPVAFQPGRNHNVEKMILLRRFIE